MSTPATKTSETLAIVTSLFNSKRPDEFSLARIKSDANILIKNTGLPADGYMLLGMAEALSFNVTEAKANFNAALKLSSDVMISSNYSTFLYRIGCFDEAYVNAANLVKHHRDDISVLKQAATLAFQAGRFRAFVELISKIDKLSTQEQVSVRSIKLKDVSISSVVNLADSLNISDDDIAERINAAAIVLQHAKEPIAHTVFDVAPSGRISIRYEVYLDMEAAIDLSMLIVEKIITEFDDPLSDLITIGCVPRDALQPTRPAEFF